MTVEVGIIPYSHEYAAKCAVVWNSIVAEGKAFPQTEMLDEKSAEEFFSAQSFTGVALDSDTGDVAGLYILHPNNIGRCGHICNASYAVASACRGRGIGEMLVRHSLEKGRELGFGILQFNAVVSTNTAALKLYEKLGFVRLGTIPCGFRYDDGTFGDIIPHYHLL